MTPLLGGIGCVRRDESVVQRMSAYVHSLMYHRSPGMDPETHCSWTNLSMPQAASRLSKLFCAAYCYAQLHTDRPVDKYWHIPAACVAAGVWQPNDTTFDCRLDTHTHIRLTALCPGLPRSAGTRKVKPIWTLLKQETVRGSGISWAICKSAPRSRQMTTPTPNHSVFLQAGCPSCLPTNSVKALKALTVLR